MERWRLPRPSRSTLTARNHSRSRSSTHSLAGRLASLASRRKSSIKFASVPSVGSDENIPNESMINEEDITTNLQATEESEEPGAPRDFTIALEQPLNPPKPPSQAWLALKAMANGDNDTEGNDEDEGEGVV